MWRAFIERLRAAREARAYTAVGILRRAEENAAPGTITAEGFLGQDVRKLLRVIREDELAFAQRGLDWKQVADRLEELVQQGSAGLGDAITLPSGYRVQVAETRGNFPCPWEDGLFRKRSATVQRVNSDGEAVGPSLLVSDLSIHLLRDHHFLQGRGSPFRLEPADLQAVLG